MSDDDANLPAVGEIDLPPLAAATTLALAGMPIGLQIFFEPTLNAYCKDAARYMSGAKGFVPPHLLGKPQSCFAVVSRSLTWRLDPFAVAQCTYETPEGKVGYMGSLCQAIIVQSGHLIGGVKFRHEGDWARVQGKFKLATSKSGKPYPVPAWEEFGAAEDGLVVIVSAHLRDEDTPREMPFYMKQAYPRFSTLWATDPRTQIQYTAVRRFGTSVVPELFMGVPFDRGEAEDWAATLKDITPNRPELADYTEPKRTRRSRSHAEEGSGPIEAATTESSNENDPGSPAKPYFFADAVGEAREFEDVDEAVAAYEEFLEKARGDHAALTVAWQNGASLLSQLREGGLHEAADALNNQYGLMLDEIRSTEATAGAIKDLAGAVAESTRPREVMTSVAAFDAAHSGGEYDVVVPWGDGVPPNTWHMLANERLKKMVRDTRPAADFARFRAKNDASLMRLKTEFRSWYNLLSTEIDKAASQTAGR